MEVPRALSECWVAPEEAQGTTLRIIDVEGDDRVVRPCGSVDEASVRGAVDIGVPTVSLARAGDTIGKRVDGVELLELAA